ncbi:NYN domain-containing protein [Aeromicrobium wangtongii]|uniref:NYN domain-containing protein n=1 Tax=Aeromicrobium wangtongii TaxID=2969247 RepID=A0ABY5M5V8_9ACTN|nr:NYN domain-containing protein [Aeromicrobium wangtongii]MCD9198515.1 NYN domain-containing protein [Aeromicrobium wangtongii]MCL3818797.1 NYN domain-containing protein [Aeromicrobium wangtongii]UUP12541.1 NYN domain-containing protein [Aeromicrobium wangtongii]
MTDRTTYVLVDGENIDATLGQSILGRRPQPHERPRWDRLLQFAEDTWDQQVTGLFFLAANNELPMPFVQALTSMGFRAVPLSGRPDEKVVDMAIQRTLEALAGREADVMLASNDGDFIEQLSPLVGRDRRTALLAFREFRNAGYVPLIDRGMEFHDLEYDVQAFNSKLPRIRVIPIDEFDPNDFL